MAHDAANGVGRRAARSGATLFRDATLTAGFGLPARLSAAPTLKHLDQKEGPADGGDHSEAEEPRLCHSADANLVSKRVNARGRLRLRCTLLRIPKREAPDVKLNWLLAADR